MLDYNTLNTIVALLKKQNVDKLEIKNETIYINGVELDVSPVVETDNIAGLTTEQCNELKCGDVIVKITLNQKHRYVVTYKEENVGLCLTYVDAANVETVSYDYVTNAWVYNSTDITPISDITNKQNTLVSGENIKTVNSESLLGSGDVSIPVVVANPTLAGTEADLTGLEVTGVKYKVGGSSKKYIHHITVDFPSDSSASLLATIILINENASPINTFNLLKNNMIEEKNYLASGSFILTLSPGIGYYAIASARRGSGGGSNYIYFNGLNNNDEKSSLSIYSSATITYNDNVIEL